MNKLNLKNWQPILELSIVSTVVFLIHKLVFFIKRNNPSFHNFHYQIETIYFFFFACSLILLFILILVKSKNIDNVGYTFLLITCSKMAIAYIVLLPILNSDTKSVAIEKINFFIVFALFLAIETIITIRIVNNNR
jgi:hypothetical protein